MPDWGKGDIAGSAFYKVSVSSDPASARMKAEVPQSRVPAPAETRSYEGSPHALRVDLSLAMIFAS